VFLPALYVTWFRIESPHSTASQHMAAEEDALSTP
jgi:hypothetical protein